MIVGSRHPIDGSRRVALHLSLPPDPDAESVREHLNQLVRTFVSFAVAGGLPVIAPAPRCEIGASPNAPVIIFDVFPYAGPGLGVLLRMLGRLTDDASTLTVFVDGERGIIGRADTIQNPSETVWLFPPRRSELPFSLEIQPVAAWVNLQVEFDTVIAEHVTMLDTAIRIWMHVGVIGGFQLPTDGQSIETPSVAISRPVEGEDFVDWYIQMPDVPPQSLNSLVNVLAHCRQRGAPIRAVYLS